MKTITNDSILSFKEELICEEKSKATVEKYVRDVNIFSEWLADKTLSKAEVLEYKTHLTETYAPKSVNAAIASLNAFFASIHRQDLKLKNLKIQRCTFAEKDKELTKAEYERLLSTAKAKNNERLYYLMQTICSTGIRVSELKFITVSAVTSGSAVIHCKSKMRTVFLPKQLCKILKEYIKRHGIVSGSVFVSKNGKPLDRSNIWADMKKLCADAGVEPGKVFPHNLRHLFARTYYSLQKDIVRLSDILGHSSVDTTRIYTMESGEVHRRQIEKMHLLRC